MYNKDYDIKTITKQEKPMVSFFDFTMYDITQDMISNVVQAKKMLIFKAREELYDATIVLKQNNQINTLSAMNIVKKDDYTEFTNDVNFQSSSNLYLRTQQMSYDKKANLVYNNSDFVAQHNKDMLYGDSFIYNMNINSLKAQNTKFKIKVNYE
jgi:hypothetical protein